MKNNKYNATIENDDRGEIFEYLKEEKGEAFIIFGNKRMTEYKEAPVYKEAEEIARQYIYSPEEMDTKKVKALDNIYYNLPDSTHEISEIIKHYHPEMIEDVIGGYDQSEWQYILYNPAKITLEEIEDAYFGKYKDIKIYAADDEKFEETVDDILLSDDTIGCISDLKKYIKDHHGYDIYKIFEPYPKTITAYKEVQK